MKIIATFAVIIAIVAGIFYLNRSRASIGTFTFTPVVDGTDNVVATEGQYDVQYVTDSTGFVSTITVQFPSIFTFNPSGLRDPSTLIQSDSATGGFISINGVDQQVTSITVTGQSLSIILTVPFDYSSTPDITDTVSFRILRQVINPTTAGDISPTGFTAYGTSIESSWTLGGGLEIYDDASGNGLSHGAGTPQSNSFTIIAGPGYTLDFTTLPSQSPAPILGDVESGAVWTIQPIVIAHDRYGNVATSYDTDVVSLALYPGALGTLTYGTSSPDHCAGGGVIVDNAFQVRADAGVADFSAALASYTATTDHESFTLIAVHTCGPNGARISDGVSSAIVADVTADTLTWTTIPAGCTSARACATQGIVEATRTNTVNAIDYVITDLDYAGDVTIGKDKAGSLVGTALQGAMTAGVLTPSGIGYTLRSAGTPETIHFTADSGSLTQGVSGDVLVTAAPVTPPVFPTPQSAGAGNNPTMPTALPVVADQNNDQNNDRETPCSPYLTAYLRLGEKSAEVAKLQNFLLSSKFLSGSATGFFDKLTYAAVVKFQEAYANDILSYWGLKQGTGYVYITTIKKINELSCKGI